MKKRISDLIGNYTKSYTEDLTASNSEEIYAQIMADASFNFILPYAEVLFSKLGSSQARKIKVATRLLSEIEVSELWSKIRELNTLKNSHRYICDPEFQRWERQWEKRLGFPVDFSNETIISLGDHLLDIKIFLLNVLFIRHLDGKILSTNKLSQLEIKHRAPERNCVMVSGNCYLRFHKGRRKETLLINWRRGAVPKTKTGVHMFPRELDRGIEFILKKSGFKLPGKKWLPTK